MWSPWHHGSELFGRTRGPATLWSTAWSSQTFPLRYKGERWKDDAVNEQKVKGKKGMGNSLVSYRWDNHTFPALLWPMWDCWTIRWMSSLATYHWWRGNQILSEQEWSNEASETLQDCLKTMDWDIDNLTECVTEYNTSLCAIFYYYNVQYHVKCHFLNQYYIYTAYIYY